MESNYTTDEAREEQDGPTQVPATQRPSLWSALWVLAALIYLGFARTTFRRLG